MFNLIRLIREDITENKIFFFCFACRASFFYLSSMNNPDQGS
jgi:hypothetical protein